MTTTKSFSVSLSSLPFQGGYAGCAMPPPQDGHDRENLIPWVA